MSLTAITIQVSRVTIRHLAVILERRLVLRIGLHAIARSRRSKAGSSVHCTLPRLRRGLALRLACENFCCTRLQLVIAPLRVLNPKLVLDGEQSWYVSRRELLRLVVWGGWWRHAGRR